ncbi:MAG: TRAP transporter 4TM/12TM fusion protein [Bacillota bacterium]|nr:MAG: TRAP transporter 4TM/12TM fusion protein [Bacillota bacterium]
MPKNDEKIKSLKVEISADNLNPKLLQITVDDAAIEEVLEKYDTESRFRKYTGAMAIVVTLVAVAMSGFHLYTAGFGTFMSMIQRSVHLSFLFLMTFLLFPAFSKSKKKVTVFDVLWLIASVLSSMYMVFFFNEFAMRGTAIPRDIYMGTVLLICILEGARRTVGKELPILSLVFLAYGFFGQYAPGIFGHTGFSFRRIIHHLYLSSEGVFGIALGVSSTFISLFILFGAFLGETGMAELINKISMAMAGRSPGGPGKVAIVASTLMGTINGSAVANVVTTGAFTIPLMKSVGYKAHFAGAVEAVASTGGQIMPPVMGAAAFVMAEFLGIQYSTIMIAAIFPALFYYLAVFAIVHLEALKTGLKGLPREMLPNTWNVFKAKGHLVIPLIVIVHLLISGRTPLYSAFYGIVWTVGCSWLRKETRLTFKGFVKAMEAGAIATVGVGMACAVVGIVIGITSLTGLGLVIGDNLISLAGGSLFLTLFLTMVVSIILGMGLPSTACYIVAATIAAPALTKLGVPPLAAHMFVFYFACLSNVTPPVALAAYAGAGIANASPSKVGWTAFRLALSGFIIPFMFVYQPSLLFIEGTVGEIIFAVVTSIIGVLTLSCVLQNYMLTHANIVQRMLLLGGAWLLFLPGLLPSFIGLGLVMVVVFWQIAMVKKSHSSSIVGVS